MGLKDDVTTAFSEYEQKLCTKDQAKAYILQKAHQYNHQLNVDNYNLGKCCMIFIEEERGSEKWQEAQDFFEGMVAPLSDSEKAKKQLEHTMNLFKLKKKEAEFEIMKKKLDDYETRNKKAVIKFTGDQFKHFVKKMQKGIDRGHDYAEIEIENGKNEYKLHLYSERKEDEKPRL